MIDMQTDQSKDKNPDLAVVYFTDGATLGPAIVLIEVGSELPELILRAFAQLEGQEIDPSIGALGAAFCFQAVGSGNVVRLLPPPLSANFPMQVQVLFSKESARGGIGTVVVDVVANMVSTYGGRGFPEVAPSNPYQVCAFALIDLEDMPASGIEPVRDFEAKAKPQKKAARKKTSKQRSGLKKRAAARKQKASTIEV